MIGGEERAAGGSLFTSDHWIDSEPLRLLAICGYRVAVAPEKVDETLQLQNAWMHRLGTRTEAA
jgi:hypothetical protein